MREITVKYPVSDKEEERLKKITEAYKEKGYNFSEDEMFENIMTTGAKYDKDQKFKFHERNLGLREKYPEECQQGIPGNRQGR